MVINSLVIKRNVLKRGRWGTEMRRNKRNIFELIIIWFSTGSKLSFAVRDTQLARLWTPNKYCNEAICIWTNKMHKILVIRLYFPLDALHVSDCISPSSEAIFYKLYIAFGMCQYVWQLCGYSHTTARRMVPAYTKGDVQLVKYCSWWWTNRVRNM